jgi:hypothetical protein
MLPPRSKRYVGHDGRIPREQTLSFLELSVGLTILIALLILVFPRDGILQRVFQENVNDPLTVAYVINLLKIDPDNPQLKGLYFKQRLTVLSWQQLRDETQQLLVSGSKEERHMVASLLLAKIGQESNKTEEMQQLVRHLIAMGLEDGWQEKDLQLMIEQALVLSETEMAHKMLINWWQATPTAPWQWLDGLAAFELGQGRYAQSALISLVSRQFSDEPAAQKRYFIQGIKTLIAGGLYQDAMDAADFYVGGLVADEQVLRKLIEVAQASGQPKRAVMYIKLLLEMQ